MAGHVVKVSVTAETKKFSRAFRNLKNETGLTHLQQAAATAVSTMAKVGAAATVALAGASAKAISMAADLEQSTGAIEAVFKATAGKMKDFSSTAATSVGLARNEYQELATILGSQLKNGGTSMDELAGKTHGLIGTAADLAAMFGGTTADAVAALSSALKGERNPIERYGVSLTQAAVEAKAAALGFEKVGGALSTEANQAATLALIMEQTADAHGAFARENDTLAHQIQVIKAKLSDAATAFGTLLLPATTTAAKVLNENLTPAITAAYSFLETRLIPAIKTIAQAAQTRLAPALAVAGTIISTTLIPAVKQVAQWLGEHLPAALDTVTNFLTNWGPALAAAATGATLVVQAFAAWSKIKAIIDAARVAMIALNVAMAANPVGLIIAAVAAAVAVLVGAFVAAYQHSETFRNAVNAAWEGIKTAATQIVDWATTTLVPTLQIIWDNLASSAKSFLQIVVKLWTTYGQPSLDAALAFIKGFAAQAGGIWEGIKTTVAGVWQVISSAITTALGVITGTIRLFIAVLTGDWAGAWQAVKNIVTTTSEGIKGIISGVLKTIGGLFRTGWNLIIGIVKGALNAIVTAATGAFNRLKSSVTNGINTAVHVIRNFPTLARKALSGMGNLLWNAGSNLIQGFIDGIKSMIGSVKGTLSDLTSMLPSWKGPADVDRVLLKENGQLLIGGLITGIKSRFGDVKHTLNTLTDVIGQTAMPELAAPTPLTSARTAGAVINVYTLTPTLETGRAIAAALADYERMNGGRR